MQKRKDVRRPTKKDMRKLRSYDAEELTKHQQSGSWKKSEAYNNYSSSESSSESNQWS